MKKLALKTMILFGLIILVGSFQLSALTTYVSPGITIGYCPSNKSISFAPKVSLGIVTPGIVPVYANITIGFNMVGKKRKGNKSSKPQLPSYNFVEIQAGTYGVGAGVGFAFVKKKGKLKTYPKYSFCAGQWLYFNVDYLRINNVNHVTYGVQGILPLPIGGEGLF